MGPLSLLTKAYTLRAGEVDVVAGRNAQQVMAIRPDPDGSVAARFWLDEATGLLLRRELLDPQGSVTHSSVFLAVRPGDAGDVDPDGDGHQAVEHRDRCDPAAGHGRRVAVPPADRLPDPL